MKKLYHYIEQLKSYIPQYDIMSNAQSSASAGWHIQHSLMVINQVYSALLHCDVASYKRKRSLIKAVILTFGIIPRGKVQSPETVRSAGDITEESLQVYATTTEKLLAANNQLRPDAYFKHPMLGHIKLQPAIRFLCIHTYHHLKIIRDIVN